MQDLFAPVRLNDWDLPHRVVMAPLTRNRAAEACVPGDLAVEYYAQRASAALIVTEGTQPSDVGQGYLDHPRHPHSGAGRGLAPCRRRRARRGGRIVVQLMHAGRVAHPDNKAGLETVAPSALAAPGEMFTASGMKPHPVPREIRAGEVAGVVRTTSTPPAPRSRRARRRGGARRQRLPDPPVPGPGREPAHRRVRRQPGQPRPVRGRGDPGGRGGDRPGAGRHPDLARRTTSRGATRPTRRTSRRRTPTLVEGIAPLGLAYLSVLADPAAGPGPAPAQGLRRRAGRQRPASRT